MKYTPFMLLAICSSLTAGAPPEQDFPDDIAFIEGVPTPKYIQDMEKEQKREKARSKGLLPGQPTPPHIQKMEDEKRRQEARDKGLLPGVPTPNITPEDRKREQKRQEARDKGLLPGQPTPPHIQKMEDENKREEARSKGLLPGVPTPQWAQELEDAKAAEAKQAPSARYKAHIHRDTLSHDEQAEVTRQFFIDTATSNETESFIDPNRQAEERDAADLESDEGFAESDESRHTSRISSRFLGSTPHTEVTGRPLTFIRVHPESAKSNKQRANQAKASTTKASSLKKKQSNER